ncbi:hypothetical protein SEVIR_2G318300v4 [Setaria viridis]|nr:hypothetical protein SEVIR_2G318300v2 [Setaria viridis]
MVHAVFLVQKRFMWANTFRLDCSVLGQPSGPVTKRKSWKGCVRPMKQTVPDTCAIMACIVAVEGMHRKVYEASHGEGKFAWKAAEVWPEILRAMCKGQNIWKEGEGANTGEVLDEIKRLRGVGIASDEVPITMPLRAWEQHVGDELLTPERVAALLDQGPCVGRLWVCPWYYWFDTAKNNDDWIYRGCGRDKRLRDESRKLYGKKATGSHAVVCFGYRFCKTGNGEETMCVLVMDNHHNEGPQRWIDVEELDAIYTLSVDCLA